MAGPEAYDQWVQINISNFAKDTLDIEDSKLEWGKFYKNGDKDKEITPQQLDGTVIKDNAHASVYSCGREDAASGTQGSLDLYDQRSQEKVCTIHWDCPWGSSTNTFGINNIAEDYSVVHGPYHKSGGALGVVKVSVNDSIH
ncbi:aegerolysin type hemolysin [Aspergillus karnatakaensis]|uniref:aegerolysin family protein n=1 Tax=Aspergillus karnatakaensis TaxID=1810916 RepID=UPI003CCD770C